jgi:hypothetical protein
MPSKKKTRVTTRTSPNKNNRKKQQLRKMKTSLTLVRPKWTFSRSEPEIS